MLKVNKLKEPAFMTEYKRKKSPKTWADYDGEIKAELKDFVLKNEQEEFCPYCEKRIYDKLDSHIEHIKDRDSYPALFQSYDNLIVSCDEKNTCGMKKGNKYSDEFINPVMEDPQDYLEYNLASGELIPKNSDENSRVYKRASYTINLLNLNYDRLKEARKVLIDTLAVYDLEYYDADERMEYLQFFIDDKYGYSNLIKAFMEL